MARGAPWSGEEVEATVASYFDMLELGLQHQPMNKTVHRRALLPLLNDRSEAAIEQKHQNISAILIEERVPYITGYKPLGNYQRLLRQVVLEQLTARRETRALIEREIARVPAEPGTPEPDQVFVEPPPPRAGFNPNREGGRVQAPRDYMLMEAQNRALGLAGERFVISLEQERLERAGRGALASKVEHVSLTKGDGLGYDVRSFEEDSRERLIEVKTTKFGEYTPFYVSRNEVEVSKQTGSMYSLYRVYSFGDNSRVFRRAGPLDESFGLDAVTFVARVG